MSGRLRIRSTSPIADHVAVEVQDSAGEWTTLTCVTRIRVLDILPGQIIKAEIDVVAQELDLSAEEVPT